MDAVEKAISSRIKKKGEVLDNSEFNGLSNFPKLIVKLMLENEYFFDCVKYHNIIAEQDQNCCRNESMTGIGALSSLASTLVSNGQIMREDGTSMILKV